MIVSVLVVLHLVVLHTVDGREVSINPSHVTSLQAGKEGTQNKLFTDDARCLIGLTDGKFVTVAEHCAVVRQLLEEYAK
jgi:hypothetical protein